METDDLKAWKSATLRVFEGVAATALKSLRELVLFWITSDAKEMTFQAKMNLLKLYAVGNLHFGSDYGLSKAYDWCEGNDLPPPSLQAGLLRHCFQAIERRKDSFTNFDYVSGVIQTNLSIMEILKTDELLETASAS